MQTHKLIATVAAALFTAASLCAVFHDVGGGKPAATDGTTAVKVTNLAPVTVRPSAADRRAAALLGDEGNVNLTSVAAHADDHLGVTRFSLLGSQLVMPYYSFGNKFGPMSKE